MRATLLAWLFVGLCASQFLIDDFTTADTAFVSDTAEPTMVSAGVAHTFMSSAGGVVTMYNTQRLARASLFTFANPGGQIVCDIGAGLFSSILAATENNTINECAVEYQGGMGNDIMPPVDLGAADGCDCWLLSVASITDGPVDGNVMTRTTMMGPLTTAPFTVDSVADICIPLQNTDPTIAIDLNIVFPPDGRDASVALNHFCCSTEVVCRHSFGPGGNVTVGDTRVLTIECTNLNPTMPMPVNTLMFNFPPMLVNVGDTFCTSFMNMGGANFMASGTIAAGATETCNATVEFLMMGEILEPQASAVLSTGPTVLSHAVDTTLQGDDVVCTIPVPGPDITIVPPPPTTAPPTTEPPTTEPPTDGPTTIAPTAEPTTAAPTQPADNICTSLATRSNACELSVCRACITSISNGMCTTFGTRSGNILPNNNNCISILPNSVIDGNIVTQPNSGTMTCIEIGFGARVRNLNLQGGLNCVLVGADASINNYVGSPASDYINLGPGSRYNRIRTFGGKDVVIADRATGTRSIETGDGPDCIQVLGSGATQEDTLISSGNGNDNVLVDQNAFVGNILGGNDEDCIVARDSSFESLRGGAGNDHIQAQRYTATSAILGNAGDDCVVIDGGNQGVNGGSGSDICLTQGVPSFPTNCEQSGSAASIDLCRV